MCRTRCHLITREEIEAFFREQRLQTELLQGILRHTRSIDHKLDDEPCHPCPPPPKARTTHIGASFTKPEND